jgi:hypothetical protein
VQVDRRLAFDKKARLKRKTTQQINKFIEEKRE